MANDLLGAQRAVFEAALDSQEKLVLLALLDHWSRAEPNPYPSIDRLAQRTDLSRRTVLRAVQRLAAKGALRVMHVGRHSAYDLGAVFRRELPSISATQTPIAPVDQCHADTGAPQAPVPDATSIGATQTPGSVPAGHPKEPTEGTQKEPRRDRARAREDAPPAKPIVSCTEPTPRKSNEILLWDVWEELAGGGMPMGSPPRYELGIAWTACAARTPNDPVSAFRVAASAYVAAKRKAQRKPTLVYLCNEIGEWLAFGLEAPEPAPPRRAKTLFEVAAERNEQIAAEMAMEATK